MHELARVAGRLFNRPLMILPETAVTIANVLHDCVGADPMEPVSLIEASRFRGLPRGPAAADGTPKNYYRMIDGVAVISMLGELVNRGAWIGASSGLISYEGLDEQLRTAADDMSVRGILLDMESPGGEASGAFETAALVREIGRTKRVAAVVNGLAASAAYAIASGASRIVTTSTGVQGSIGVVMVHLDRSAALQRAGVKPTLIYAGAHKADTSSAQPLGDEARARLQAHVDEVYDLFVGTVAQYRDLDADAVRATEAGIFMGASAVEAGLADAVGTFDDALAWLRQPRTGVSLYTGVPSMTDLNTILRAEHESLMASAVTSARTTAYAEGVEAGRREGATAERDRIRSICSCEEARGREATAQHIAYNTAMALDDARSMLASVPVAAAPPPPTRMSQTPRPDVRPGTGSPGPDADPQAAIDAAWSGIAKSVSPMVRAA
jgi:signal peptide peptidase SppA